MEKTETHLLEEFVMINNCCVIKGPKINVICDHINMVCIFQISDLQM